MCQSCFIQFTIQVLYTAWLRESRKVNNRSGMKLTAKQNCSASIQVLQRFSFQQKNVSTRQLCNFIQQASNFHKKDGEEMLVLRTLCNKKVKFAFFVHSKVDQRLNSSLLLKWRTRILLWILDVSHLNLGVTVNGYVIKLKWYQKLISRLFYFKKKSVCGKEETVAIEDKMNWQEPAHKQFRGWNGK